MTDKVQKMREELARLKEETSIGLSEHENGVEQGRMEIINTLSIFLDSLQEEPVSEDLEEASRNYADNEEYGNDVYFAIEAAFKAGAEWQKEKDAILPHIRHRDTLDEFAYQCAYDLSNDWAKEAPEWKDVKTACKLGAQWQKEQFEKNRLAACDKQTQEEAEIERDFVTSIIEKEHRQPTFDDAIKYGMKLREEQMMAKAIDAHCFGFQGAALFSFRLPADNYLVGSKVKVIVTKEK